MAEAELVHLRRHDERMACGIQGVVPSVPADFFDRHGRSWVPQLDRISCSGCVAVLVADSMVLDAMFDKKMTTRSRSRLQRCVELVGDWNRVVLIVDERYRSERERLMTTAGDSWLRTMMCDRLPMSVVRRAVCGHTTTRCPACRTAALRAER